MWDFGDAPDPEFPSLAASDGARHANISFEWLGEGVDAEPDSRQIDRDLYDDGVTSGELLACTQQALEVEITVQSRENPEHLYDAQHLLYLNVLVDWNGDGSWSGTVDCPQGVVASEWAVRNLPIDVSTWPDGALSTLEPVVLTAGPLAGPAWARFSLSYAEVVSGDDWDGRGTFTYGETEDYSITVSLPPTAWPEVAEPTAASVTPTAVGTAAAPGPMGPASWWSLPCLGGAVLLFILALVLVIMALRTRSRLPLIMACVVVVVLLTAFAVSYKYAPSLAGTAVVPESAGEVPTPRERLVPTAAETAGPSTVTAASSPTILPTWTSTPEPEQPRGGTAPSATQSGVTTPSPSLYSTRDRFGFGAALPGVEQYDVEQLHAGWYLDWSAHLAPARPQGMEYVQMVKVGGGKASVGSQDLERIARTNPGSVWLIGNEPDVLWQDDLAPPEYARVYHDLYGLLKSADPTCQVAIGGVSQPTALRLQYLDLILDAYRDLYGQMIPVDVWNVHNFILREERGSWGVDIPPGISVDQGQLFEIEDHDSLEIFRQQILNFRQWMKDRGERDKPLIVSEYGIVMPSEYGFPEERVRDFMYATFDFFMTARDPDLGYAPDDGRLVQRWCWYSLSDTVYPTGNLFDTGTGQITPLGLAYGSYVLSH
jgi:hypothetical protein